MSTADKPVSRREVEQPSEYGGDARPQPVSDLHAPYKGASFRGGNSSPASAAGAKARAVAAIREQERARAQAEIAEAERLRAANKDKE